MPYKDYEAQKAYYYRNKDKMLDYQRRYRANGRRPLYNKEHKGLFAYAVFRDERIVKETSIKKLSEKIFISEDLIFRSFRNNNGYCKCLDCWLVKSRTELSDYEVISKVKEYGWLKDKEVS